MIDGPEDIRREWLECAATADRTAGAAAPEAPAQKLLTQIEQWGATLMRPGGDA